MVDYFAIGLTHALLALAAWRLVMSPALDRDPETENSLGPDKPDV